MDESQRNLAALTVLMILIVVILIVVGVFISKNQIISPIPGEGAIKIIFLSPTPQVENPGL